MNYQELVDIMTPKENKWKNIVYAFISGGIIGSISELLVSFFSIEVMMIIWIILSSILTGMGVGDDIVEKYKMGVVVPITGFSHSVTSASLEYKYDGMISGIGSNYLKLAGSVILYGIISSSILYFIRMILCIL